MLDSCKVGTERTHLYSRQLMRRLDFYKNNGLMRSGAGEVLVRDDTLGSAYKQDIEGDERDGVLMGPLMVTVRGLSYACIPIQPLVA
ncbi:RRNA biogenesis protein RRP5 [Giardia duodenalis]|uniref:rRNA biogenesis protein RRP5 n=1 Tax=Giardia intestinalis TaxID=5741 RepID=V6TP06_GIAIN|nr:RRNA biogenesis protein RRP5 [Giardia intestinalis]